MLIYLKRMFDPFHKEIEFKVKEFAKTLPNNSLLLNAGSGEDAYSEYFSHCETIGIDLCIGDNNWDYSSVDIVGDLHKIPLKSEKFDGAVCIVVLEHLHTPHIFFKELNRVLKSGGVVFFVFPFMWELHQTPFDFFRFTEFGFKQLAIDNGFKVIKIEKMGYFFRVLHYRAASFIKNTLKHPLMLVLLIPILPFIIFLMFFSEILDRMFQLCDHTLGYNSILKKE